MSINVSRGGRAWQGLGEPRRRTARNAKEMYRIFARCNALFVRPHIRAWV